MFISTVHEFENLEKLKKSGIDGIIIGIPFFSIRQSNLVEIDDLK
ncbi:MAG: U32 family peptidase, partial [Holdemanella sp.]|nr:U32 family peptidase [Holdemanella sp.]